MRSSTFFGRYATVIVVCFAFIAPTLFYGARSAVRSNTNKVEDWLPSGFPETADLAWFRGIFGGHMFVLISWDGCRLGGDPDDPTSELDDPRIERLARLLVPDDPAAIDDLELDGNDRAVDPQPLPPSMRKYFKSVLTGRRLLNQLTSDPINLPYETALRRLTGALIGPDGHQTCVLISLSDESLGEFRRVIGRGTTNPMSRYRDSGIIFKALRMAGIDPAQARMGGPPVDNVAIDEEGERTLARLAAFSGVITILLAWWALRSVTATLIVLACGVLSGAGGLAMVWLTGGTTDAILISMPPLVYVLAVSGSIHIINYYRQGIIDHGPEGAADRALAHGWKPAFLCSVTTSFGLLSLLASDLVPVRKFGFYSAMGVLLMLVVLFLFLPAALQLWPIPLRNLPKRKSAGEADVDDPVTRFWTRFGGWIVRHHVLVASACVLFITVTGAGVMRARTTIDLMKLFDPNARILSDYVWLEENVGRLVPLEVVLRVPSELLAQEDDSPNEQARLSLLQRMGMVTHVHRAIVERFGRVGEGVIGPPMSAMTFIEALPAPAKGIASVVRKTTANAQLNQSYVALQKSNYLHTDPNDGTELWRISLRVGAFDNVDYGQFIDELRDVINPILAEQNKQIVNNPVGGEISAVYTGVVPIVYKAQRSLLNSLIESTIYSFTSITPVVMLVSRGVLAGLVAMMPNVLPVLVIFGGMGWLGITIDIGSMMSASIALGVAVDDTIHYLTWFRDELNVSRDRHQAILGAYRRCATPTLQAAMINGFGLSVFALSTFTPTRQFGYLMLIILIAGVIAELILLPALLAGPLGAVFKPSRVNGPKGPLSGPSPTPRTDDVRKDPSHRQVPDSHVSSRFARDLRP